MINRSLSKKIILAEDNIADFELTKLAFEELSIPVEIIHMGDGQEVLTFLKTAVLSEISLMLLDLNMPKIGGLEILKIMYDDDELKKLPVIVLSSSLQESDVLSCYEYGANAYIKKPIDYNEFNVLIQSIANFWIGINLGPIYETNVLNE